MYPRTEITLIILTLILVGTLTIVLGQTYITGNIVRNDFSYSFTKAICNNENFCEDYEIYCDGKNLIRLNPTGAAVQFPESWKDPRNKEQIEKSC